MHVLTPVLVPPASPGHGRQNKRKPRGSRGFSHAPKRTRTSTGHTAHKALNLARLPIPPPAQGQGENSGRSVASVRGPRYLLRTHVPPGRRPPVLEGGARHGPDQAPARDLRLHQEVLGQVRL